jgi:hypothetical protein
LLAEHPNLMGCLQELSELDRREEDYSQHIQLTLYQEVIASFYSTISALSAFSTFTDDSADSANFFFWESLRFSRNIFFFFLPGL